MITREEVLKLLEYDPVTGVFTWRVARRGVTVGAEAGCVSDCGGGKFYRKIMINGRGYPASRLAWLILTGGFPKDQIYHVDGNGLNNVASNLRVVTNAENEILSREDVLALLDYDAATGVFTCKVARGGKAKAGGEVGAVTVAENGKSYRRIKISRRSYMAHRLAWLVITGEFPDDQIDHINGNGLDNRAVNLRAVTNAENAKNYRKPVTNTSGVVGVYRRNAGAKWQVLIGLNGKLKHIGIFDDFEKAVAVRKEAERIHGFHPNHGSERPL